MASNATYQVRYPLQAAVREERHSTDVPLLICCPTLAGDVKCSFDLATVDVEFASYGALALASAVQPVDRLIQARRVGWCNGINLFGETHHLGLSDGRA